jgi:hypothetical protein
MPPIARPDPPRIGALARRRAALLAGLLVALLAAPAGPARAAFLLTWNGPGIVQAGSPFAIDLAIGSDAGDFLFSYQVTFTVTRVDAQPTGGAMRFTGASVPPSYVLAGDSAGLSVVAGAPLPPTTLRIADATASGFNTADPVPASGRNLVRLSLAPNLSVFAGEQYRIAVDLSPSATFFLRDFADPADPPDPRPVAFRVVNPAGGTVAVAAVPEPSSLALLAAGGLALAWRCARSRRAAGA